jgi:peptidoglycan/xylan/chitin deacetylase (PgdA/CDA1 family)
MKSHFPHSAFFASLSGLLPAVYCHAAPVDRIRHLTGHLMLGWFSPRIFFGPAQRRLSRRGVPVYAYHKIAAPPPTTRDPFLYVSPGRFEQQLADLRNRGWTSASLADVLAAQGNPGRQAVITFDDGCRNVLEHGLESLLRHRFSAIQFLVAGFLGRTNEWDVAKGDVPEPLMDQSQVREWLAAGHEIGSHSVTHRNLRHLAPADAREEIFASKKSLEDRFGLEVRHFCYPYGSWNAAVHDLVAEAGYRTACTMRFGVNTAASPPYGLRRIIPLSCGETLAKIQHRLAQKIRGR